MRLGVEAAIVEGELLTGDVEVADGRIVSVGLAPSSGGGIAVPGFVDLQVNGFAGVDFAAADAAGYATAGDALLETRRHRLPADVHHRARAGSDRRAGRVPAEPAGPRILGVHLEGPFLSPAGSARTRQPRGAIPTVACSSGCSPPARSATSRSRPSCPARSS